MSHMPDVNPVIDAVKGRTLPGAINAASLAAIGLGLGAFLFGMFAGGEEGAAWSWGAVLVGIVYTLALAQGGVMYGVLMAGTWARWGRPLKRVVMEQDRHAVGAQHDIELDPPCAFEARPAQADQCILRRQPGRVCCSSRTTD